MHTSIDMDDTANRNSDPLRKVRTKSPFMALLIFIVVLINDGHNQINPFMCKSLLWALHTEVGVSHTAAGLPRVQQESNGELLHCQRAAVWGGFTLLALAEATVESNYKLFCACLS